jgi:hypothetical protein
LDGEYSRDAQRFVATGARDIADQIDDLPGGNHRRKATKKRTPNPWQGSGALKGLSSQIEP